jgi:transcriptional regulator with XRE-family HTH domain
MNETTSPISERLRRAIVEGGIPLLKVEQETGVQRASLSRFVNGKQSLRLDIADKLAIYFGLELRAKRKGKVNRGDRF